MRQGKKRTPSGENSVTRYTKKKGEFSTQAFLDSAGVSRKVRQYKKAEIVFSQGKPAESIMYIQEGGVKITVEIGRAHV